MSEILLKVEGLKQHFKVGGKRVVKAVDGVSFEIKKGETFGLVGESGSGKSTTGRSLIKLYTPTDGKITFKGEEIHGKLDKQDTMALRRNMQMIFQDPYASLNPRMTIETILSEGLDIHFPKMSKKEKRDKIIDLLKTVGLADYHLTRYPHEFSGGQLQRIGIARALAVDPDFIIADEPISALDVSIQAQVVNLLKKLQKERGLTYLFIAHDLAMVRYLSDTIAVMHLGNIVEIGPANLVYDNPIHPYTKSLLSAVPQPDPISEKTRKRIRYDVEGYDKENSEMREVEEGHFVYCTKEEFETFTAGKKE